ncbi:MAG: SDR family NAD(P)-dependent oxidoreductase [Pseudomonadota bacterium]
MDDQTFHDDALEPIAITGMSVRVPGAKQIDKFWHNLRDGVESITFFTDETLIAAGISPAFLKDSHYVKAFGMLEDMDMFDAPFFDLTPREVEVMDPQHRLFLECAWEVLESAGYNPETYKGRIGVYAGVGLNSYLLNNIIYNKKVIESVGGWQVVMSNDKDFVPTRVSYKLNLKGPSVCVSTGCSTSLVAIAMGCQSLLNYQCDMVLAGGATIQLPQITGYWYTQGGIASPDGHCRAFDARAQGTLDANGVGIVVLKRLEDALADGDCIHAVIKGFAINNDGSLKVGYTAPSVDGQAEVITEALAMAGLEADTISYIEAHGTGTDLGDPVEMAALTQAFRASTDKNGFCAVGSVKSNLGHLDTAAGVAGLIKTVQALKHKQIPPSLHFEQPNPQIDFANSPFYVNAQLTEWKTNGTTPRRAGVSSFGIGGTNAHIVLEEAPKVPSSGPSRPWQLLLLSAKTSNALETATANLADYLQQHPAVNLADMAYTLAVGRSTFKHRRMLVCQTSAEAINVLQDIHPQSVFTSIQARKERPVVFMFPGMGSEYVNMAMELYQQEPIFREQVDICVDILKTFDAGLDFQSLIPNGHAPTALFVVEYALAQLWITYGVRPQAMIGYSGGEYVAACLAGVFSLEDALSVFATSEQVIQQLPKGSMLAVSLPEQSVQPLLLGNNQLSLAAITGVSQCVVSGSTEAIDALQSQLVEQGVQCSLTPTTWALHSEMMQPAVTSLLELFKKIKLNPPKIPWVSGVTGTWITDAEAMDARYYAQQVTCQTVYFADGLRLLFKEPEYILLEVGPKQVLSPLATQHPDLPSEQVVLASLIEPQYNQSEVASILSTLGKLWLAGVAVDWSGFYVQEQRHRLPLPTYPFERKQYWLEPQEKSSEVAEIEKKPDIADWFYLPSWQRSLLETSEVVKTAEDSVWLVFMDEDGLAASLVKQLEHSDVITVQRGPVFTQLGKQHFALNETQSSDYEALFNALQALGKTPTKVVHSWLLSEDNETLITEKGFYSLLFLGRALGNAYFTAKISITVISNDMQEVTGEERLCPHKATVLGPVKVIPQEYPNISCRSIDVVMPESGSWQAQKLIDQLLVELTTPSSQRVIAYRGNHRWVQTFEPVRLDNTAAGISPLREGGVYLLTGGLGDIGLTLAEYLAKTVKAKLILTGRSKLPARDEWEQWLTTHDDSDRTSQKLRKVQALEELGAQVLVATSDVADLAQMQAVISKAEARFGQLNGVIHAAGIVGKQSFCTISDSNKAECEKHFQSKMYGLLVLEKVLRYQELDFCVLLSSLSNVLGGLGFAAYSAANLFMDAFVNKYNKTHSIPWLSVNWEGWQFEETVDESSKIGAELEALAMTPLEGVKAWQQILSVGNQFNQVVVSSATLQARIKQWVELDATPSSEDSKVQHERPSLLNPYVAPRNELETTLVDIWQKLLGMSPIGIYDNFFELGGNSLLATQLMSRIRKTFNIELSLRQLFESPTVAELVGPIETMIKMVHKTAVLSPDEEEIEL